MNVAKSQGMVLICCLMVILLITILGLSSMDVALVQLKMANYYKISRELFTFVDVQARQIEKNEKYTCLHPESLTGYYFNQLESEWDKQKPCYAHTAVFELYYLIEQLKENPCLQVLILNEKGNVLSYGTVYYRLTLLGKSKILNISTVQQIVFTKLGTAKPRCGTEPVMVSLGRQSWRERSEW